MPRRAETPNALGLTPTQSRVLDFIRLYIAARGNAPSFTDVATHCGFRSKASVADVLTQLETRGHIVRESGRARSIKLVDDKPSLIAALPDDLKIQVTHLALRSGRDPDHIIIEACRDGIEQFYLRLKEKRRAA